HKVQRHLRQLPGIADRHGNRLEAPLDADIVLRQLALDQHNHVLDGVSYLVQAALRLAAARERQQATGDAAATHTRAYCYFKSLVFIVDFGTAQAKLSVAQDASQQVVKLMRDASRESSKRGQLGGTHQLNLLETQLLEQACAL